jgi:hypothetical protein
MVKLRNSYLKNLKPLGLATASPALPPVFGLGIADHLPLHVRNCVGSAAGERLYVISAVAGAPLVLPVEGQGCSRWNSRVTSRDRYSLAESAVEAIAIATMHETSFEAVPISTSVSRSIPPASQDDPLGSRIVRQDVGSRFGRPRTDTNWQLRAACRRSLDNARRRERPPPSSQAPKRFRPQDDERRGRDDDPERGHRQVTPRRQSSELAHDELEIALEQREIGSRLIGLSQR